MVEFLVLVLAVGQTVEVWRHSRMPLIVRFRDWCSRRPGSLLWWYATCMWCFSVVCGIALASLMSLSDRPGWQGLKWFLWGLAVSRAANWFNDFNYELWRTPERRLYEEGIKEAEAHRKGREVHVNAPQIFQDRAE